MFCISGGMCLIGGMRGGPPIPYPVEYLVVAGGGSGSSTPGTAGGGGGGAGGVMCGTFNSCFSTTYTIQVGAGGVDSCLGCVVTSCRGGGGGYVRSSTNPNYPFNIGCGFPGGSGGGGIGGDPNQGFGSPQNPAGGASVNTTVSGYYGGGGVPQATTSPQGYPFWNGGGGGGRSAAGGSNLGTTVSGGNGQFFCINQAIAFGELFGGCYYLGGGGAGGSANHLNASCECGRGIGGGGGLVQGQACSGRAFTGGGGAGGGGPGSGTGGGGSGAVIIRFCDTNANAVTTGSPCFYSCGGYKYYLFTGSGTISFNG